MHWNNSKNDQIIDFVLGDIVRIIIDSEPSTHSNNEFNDGNDTKNKNYSKPSGEALKRKTGARGLRSIVESILMETMFELPSQKNVSKVLISEDVVKGLKAPVKTVTKSSKAKAA